MKKTNKSKHSKKQLQANIISFGVVSVLMISIIILAHFPKQNLDTNLNNDPRESIQSKYDDLVKKLTQTNVCPGIVPVHIFREENGVKLLHATGGMMTGDSNILTCGHAFWDIPSKRKKPWKFYFQTLQPYERQFRPINRLITLERVDTNSVYASKDVIVCVPGPEMEITPIQPPDEALSGELLVFGYYTTYKEKRAVRSTVTGEIGNIIGEARLKDGPGYFVLDMETFQSQSGTIYAGDDNRTLYILSKSVILNSELRKVFKLDKSCTGVSLCSSVKF